MPELSRRQFVLGLLGTAGLIGTSRAIGMTGPSTTFGAATASAQHPLELLPPPPRALRIPLPGGGELSRLPGDGDLLALTLDDGANTEVVRRYAQLAKATGLRLTCFVNGIYESWRENAQLLRPLVDSGQIQLGNHTWSHADLTQLSKDRIADEIVRNHQFLKDMYGVDATPYFRPPYGATNTEIDSVAADLGYSVKALSSGSLADSDPVGQDHILKMADRYFIQQNIVVGHLNHLPVTEIYPALLNIVRSRNLRTVTLDDVFLRPEIARVVSG